MNSKEAGYLYLLYIYETRHKTWQIYCTFGGIRYLKHRAKKSEALEEAKKLADEIALGLSPISGIARKKWEAILEAEKRLAPFGVGIEEVIRQYVEKHKGLAKRITVDEAARSCLAAKQSDTWLKPFLGRQGRIIPKGVNQHVRPLVRELWGKWPQNCLRHSWVSYRLAQIQNAAQVALEAGNSPNKIFTNYRSIKLPDGRLITKKLAEKWFSIMP